jgi:cytochrome c-type biogenesis protein CcmF
LNSIKYIGENLIPGQIGHFAIVLSFASALLAAVSYFFSTQKFMQSPTSTEGNSWRKMARIAFGVHGISVLTVIGSLFYMMINKRFEYFYAHSHTDTELQFKYVFAAFWEGQEGSFLLWMFWHVVLGAVLLFKGKTWESPTLSILATIQVFLSSMILGLHFGIGEHIIKWGSNPTLLLRATQDIPLFQNPDYLAKLAPTAKGLNPLLQNYWMTIHPPTLFLGFASTSIPFCFAIAGLWTKRYTEWLKPVLPWALFSGAILGIGILMGGAWAYEALSFGGYWAWDPVENMSLVPWLVLVAAIHTNLIAKATNQSIRTAFLFYILSFLLVVYSTFLTRSGILGNTSVHAFSEIGLEWQLVIFQAFFLFLALGIFFKRYNRIPAPEKEEAASSREFWMFIGSLVLIFSAVLITFTTSIPVYNKIFGFFADKLHLKPLNLTSPVEPVEHYNKYQLWIGVFVGMLSGATQYLRFRESNFAAKQTKVLTHLAVAVLISAAITILGTYWIHANTMQYRILMFAGIFTVVTNIDYLFFFIKNNLRQAGSVISHVGFGLMIIGIMASGLNKRWISSNRFAMEGLVKFASDEQYKKNILLIKDAPMYMNGYQVTYLRDTTIGNMRTFDLKFDERDSNNKTIDTFSLQPYMLYNKDQKIASVNPQTQHYWNKDIFTHIASLPPAETDPKIAQQEEDSLRYTPLNLAIGETYKGKTFTATIEGINSNPITPKYKPEVKDVAIGIKIKVRTIGSDSTFNVEPLVLLREGNLYQLPGTVSRLGIRFKGGDKIFDQIFGNDDKLKYEDYTFKQGESKLINGKTIELSSITPNPSLPAGFEKKEGDICMGANLNITANNKAYTALPVYLIRGNQPIPIKDDIKELGLHLAIGKVDPSTKEIHIMVAQTDPNLSKIPIEFAENAPRSDYLILETIVFPGINYFWIGTIMMMSGLAISMFKRMKKEKIVLEN